MTTCRLKESERAELLLETSAAGSPTALAAKHFAGCRSCAEAFARQAAIWKALDGWEMPPVSSGFNRGLYAKIDAAAAAPWFERWAAALKPVFAQPGFALGMAVTVIVAGFVLDHPVPSGMSVPPTQARTMQTEVQHAAVQVSTSEAEQVEKTLDDLEMLRQFEPGLEEKGTASKAM